MEDAITTLGMAWYLGRLEHVPVREHVHAKDDVLGVRQRVGNRRHMHDRLGALEGGDNLTEGGALHPDEADAVLGAPTRSAFVTS